MKSKYTHTRTCVYNINYHIIWCVKYRRKILTSHISNRLYQIIQSIADKEGFECIDCKVGDGDHVHCFVSAPPKYSVSQIVKQIKGISGHSLFVEFPEIRKVLWNGQLWSPSYFCETIGSTSEENILKYIERQRSY